jgi:hypothetical protein
VAVVKSLDSASNGWFRQSGTDLAQPQRTASGTAVHPATAGAASLHQLWSLSRCVPKHMPSTGPQLAFESMLWAARWSSSCAS